MHISEEIKSQQSVVPYIDEESNNVYGFGIYVNDVKLRTFTLPPFNWYEWHDFDLRASHLLMEQLGNASLEQSSSGALREIIDANSTESRNISFKPIIVPSVYALLLVFIRYLQFIKYIPWTSLPPVCNRPIESPQAQPTANPIASLIKPKKRKKNHHKQSNKPGLCGLTNIGNTCFMNSALQCLSNIPPLTRWAQKQKLSKYLKPVTKAYISLIQSMWSGENECVTPRDIKQRVSQHAPIFSDYNQKDSHEFMNSLLNALHAELEEIDSADEHSSVINDIFRIKTQSGVTCLHCDTCDPIEEPTYCLPLPLGNESIVSLDKLLDDFLKEEQLDGEYYCSNCQELRLAKQKTSICHPLPPVIIIQLKRFTFDDTYEKINTLVDYPIDNWCIDDNGDDKSFYDLLAVSMHVGSLRGGHYTTYARLNASDQWYHFNDSFFEPVYDKDCVVNRNAYVLVYLKKN